MLGATISHPPQQEEESQHGSNRDFQRKTMNLDDDDHLHPHDQYNTTIYGLDDRYRGILNERRKSSL